MIRNGDIVCILISINIRKCNNRNLHSFTVNSNQRNHGINSNKFLKNYSCIKKIYCKVYYIKNKMKSQKIKRSLKRIISHVFSFWRINPFSPSFQGLSPSRCTCLNLWSTFITASKDNKVCCGDNFVFNFLNL